MPNIAAALRSEVTRIARKEIRAQTEDLRKTLAATRVDLRNLKQRLQAAEKELTRLQRAAPPQAEAPAPEPAARAPRFSPGWLTGLRTRLGLTQSEMARLVGVSPLSIYNWESGRVRPRDSFIHTIAAVRAMGRVERATRLVAAAEASRG